MSEPAISVLVPARNLRPFIGEALASIQAQSRPVQEIIVVDDASDDGTDELLRALAQQEPRLRLLTGEGRGAPAARNLGLLAAGGQVIAFLDGDDIWPRDKIERQMERLLAADGPDIVSGLVQRFHCADANTHAPADAGGPALPTASLAACLFRREVFARIGLLDETLLWSDDHDFMLRAREAGLRIVIMRRIALYYRRRAGSLSQDASAPRDFQLLDIVHRSLKRRRQAGTAMHLVPLAELIET
jgi:glycosyltransferase involved in cell wall biosynthesis